MPLLTLLHRLRRSGARVYVALAIALLAASGTTACQSVVRLSSTPSPTLEPTATPAPAATSTFTPAPTLTSTPTATLEPLRLRVHLLPPQVQQGHTIVFEIASNRTVAATGTFLGRSLEFLSTSDRTWALAGVPAAQKPGSYPVELSIRDSQGTTVATTTSLTVLDQDFGTEVVIIPESRVDLMSPEVLTQEAARLAPVYATDSPLPLWQGLFIWPHEGPVTTPFGMHRTYNDGRQGHHAAVDIDGVVGAPVVSSAAGRVVLAEALLTHGNTVVVDHGLGVLTVYSHLNAMLVEPGQQVSQGQVLGELGNSGLSTGPHLHWELRVGGVPVDPLEWIERGFPDPEE